MALFAVTRYRAITVTDDSTGETTRSWGGIVESDDGPELDATALAIVATAETSDGWVFDPTGTTVSQDGDRQVIVSKPRLIWYRGLSSTHPGAMPDIFAGDRLALRAHPNGVAADWAYDPTDTSRLFDIDGEPGANPDPLPLVSWDIPVKRVL